MHLLAAELAGSSWGSGASARCPSPWTWAACSRRGTAACNEPASALVFEPQPGELALCRAALPEQKTNWNINLIRYMMPSLFAVAVHPVDRPASAASADFRRSQQALWPQA